MSNLSRRHFLKSAGGVTFLALTPVGRGLFAATTPSALKAAPPVFTALPYIQPGNHSNLVPGQEGLVVTWQTEAKPADFLVEFGEKSPSGSTAPVTRNELWAGEKVDGSSRFVYHAVLANLELGTRYQYRVSCNGSPILEGFFTTRQPRGKNIRFVTFGDNSYGDISDRAIAYLTHQQNPDFVMNVGDNVYDAGRLSEYERYFFPVYNADVAQARVGGPVLRSVPFYTVLANHDVRGHDEKGNIAADFDKQPDSLAYYSSMHLPLNGPVPAAPTPTTGGGGRYDQFLATAADRFPRMANYSFDFGDAHMLCLDSNLYVNPLDPGLMNWIDQDLGSTDALWKFVTFHHPAYNVGIGHYSEQHMRVLSPIFEKYNVDFGLHGHEHCYQRGRPIRFAPKDTSKASLVNAGNREVPGDFTIDREFDGVQKTTPKGVIYLTTGAGGKQLYDANWNQNPSRWLWPEDNNADYVVNFVSDRHSLTVFDLNGPVLDMVQIDEWGQEIDRLRVTKA